MGCVDRNINATGVAVGNLVADDTALYPAIPERRYGRQPGRLNLVGMPNDVALFNASARRQKAALDPLLNNLVRDDILYHLEYDEDGEEPPAWAKALIGNLAAAAADSDEPYEDQVPTPHWPAGAAADERAARERQEMEAEAAARQAQAEAARARARSAVVEEGRPPRDIPRDPRQDNPYAPTRVRPLPNTYRVRRAAGAASTASRAAAERQEHLAEATERQRVAAEEAAAAAAAEAAATAAATQAQRQQEDEAAIFAAAQQDGQAPNAVPVPPATDETERDIAAAQAEAHIEAARHERRSDRYTREGVVHRGRQTRLSEAERLSRTSRVAMRQNRRMREFRVDHNPPGPEQPVSQRTRARTQYARATGMPLFDSDWEAVLGTVLPDD